MKGLVWGYTFQDGCKKMDDIKSSYLLYGYKIVKEVKTKQSYYIIFDNGDYWKVIRLTDSARGNKANLSYVDSRIENQEMLNMIRACTVAGPWNAVQFYYGG